MGFATHGLQVLGRCSGFYSIELVTTCEWPDRLLLLDVVPHTFWFVIVVNLWRKATVKRHDILTVQRIHYSTYPTRKSSVLLSNFE